MNPSDSRRPHPTPLWMRVGIGLTVLLCLLGGLAALGLYFIDRAGERTWQTYRAEATARGVKWSIEDFLPPPVPDEQNVAAAPIFEEAMRASRLNLDGPFDLPMDCRRIPEGDVIDLVEIQKALSTNGPSGENGGHPARNVLRELETYDAALRQVREALARPACRWPVEWEKGDDAELIHVFALRDLVTLLRVRMACHLALGESGLARQDFEFGMKVQDTLNDDPILLSALMRMVMVSDLRAGIREGLVRQAWTSEDLRHIEELLAKLDVMAWCGRALDTERVSLNDTFEGCVSGRKSASAWMRESGGSRFVQLCYPAGWVREDQTFANQVVDEHLSLLDTNRHVFRGPGCLVTGLEARCKTLWVDRYALAVLLSYRVDRSPSRFALCATRIAMTRVACALGRYRIEKGVHPARIEDLVPDFLASLPVNPDGGGALRYVRDTDGGYTLSSDGPFAASSSSSASRAEWTWHIPGEISAAQTNGTTRCVFPVAPHDPRSRTSV